MAVIDPKVQRDWYNYSFQSLTTSVRKDCKTLTKEKYNGGAKPISLHPPTFSFTHSIRM